MGKKRCIHCGHILKKKHPKGERLFWEKSCFQSYLMNCISLHWFPVWYALMIHTCDSILVVPFYPMITLEMLHACCEDMGDMLSCTRHGKHSNHKTFTF